MSGRDQMQARGWSTRQRLVVLTFDTPQQASTFDLTGGFARSDVLTGVFDVERVDHDQLDALLYACRDVIDAWDDIVGDDPDAPNDVTTRGSVEMSMWVARLRRAVYDLRQGAMA